MWIGSDHLVHDPLRSSLQRCLVKLQPLVRLLMSRKPSQQIPIWVWPMLGVLASFGVVALVGGTLLSLAGLGPASAPAPPPSPTPTPTPTPSQPVRAAAAEEHTPVAPTSATRTPIAKQPIPPPAGKRLPAAPMAAGRSFAQIKRTFAGQTEDPEPFHAKDQTPSNRQTTRLLNRTWFLGYSAENGQRFIREYVSSGETVQNWTELVTHQGTSLPASREKLSQIANLTRQVLNNNCKSFRWTTNKSSPNEILYSWSHRGCAGYPAQEERSVIRYTIDGFCRWAYTTYKLPLTPEGQRLVDRDLLATSCG